MRQIAGAFSEYEKTRLVAKLRAARERKRVAAGKCEGRKSWAEICAAAPDDSAAARLVIEAKRLRRRSPKGHQRSLRNVAAELANSATSTSAVRCSLRLRSSRCSIVEKSPDGSAAPAAVVDPPHPGLLQKARSRAGKSRLERAYAPARGGGNFLEANSKFF
jgi:hypothetical protein